MPGVTSTMPSSWREGAAWFTLAARAITGWLAPRVGGELVADLDGVPAFQEERAAQWARIDAASFLSVEEKRRMAGLG